MTKVLQLGRQVAAPKSPDQAQLDRIPNPFIDIDYIARFTAPEVTSLCPITQQPDFATFIIDYAPARYLVESKSLKLFLFSLRNHGAYHEACTLMVGTRLVELLHPKFFRIVGIWNARGGIPIDVFWQHGELPKGAYLPELSVPFYRPRG